MRNVPLHRDCFNEPCDQQIYPSLIRLLLSYLTGLRSYETIIRQTRFSNLQPCCHLLLSLFSSITSNCNVKIWNRSQVTGPSHYAIFYGIDWQPINFQKNIFTATRNAVQYSGVVGGPLQCHSALLRFNGIHLFKKGKLIKIKIYRIIFAFEKSFFLFDMAFLTRDSSIGYWNFWYGYYNEKQNPLKPWDFEFDHSLNRLHIVLI